MELSITKEELTRRQSLPLSEKVEMSQCVIEQWWKHWDELVYISFSGGRDSTVLLHLVRSTFPDIPAVFIDTGLEYPEIKQFVRTIDNVTTIRPKLSFRQVIEKYGYPIISKEQSRYLFDIQTSKSEKLKAIRLEGNRWGMGKISKKWRFLIDAPFGISNKCCYKLKKDPIVQYEKKTGRKGYLGTLADESFMRTTTYLRYGCNMYDRKRPISQPMSFWTKNDVLEYANINNISFSPIYDMGYNRTGCMFCAFGVHLEKQPNKFQLMKHTHPKLWKYCVEDLGMKEVLDFIKVPYE